MKSFQDYLDQDPAAMMDHPACLRISTIFQEAAHNANTHRRLYKELNKRYTEDAEQFKIEFSQCLTIMFAKEKLIGLETALDFASTFIVEFDSVLVNEESQEEGLVTPIFFFIFAIHDSSSQTLRFRACEFLNQCLKKMGDQAFVDQIVYEKIASTMLERLQDKSHNVRAQAVMALRRIQEPQNRDCNIMKAFMFHMENDPSPLVRAMVIKHVALNKLVIPLLFNRIRDVHLDVKKAAFKSIARAKIQRFSIQQRQDIIQYGMQNPKVKSYVIDTLLTTWFQRTNCTYIEFLHLLHVETLKEEITENILFALFKNEPLTNLKDLVKGWQTSDKLIPIDELTGEKVTVWRFLTLFLCVEGAKEEDFDEDIILEILPNLSPFAAYLQEYLDSCNVITFDNKYIMKQLVEIVSFYPFSDEMGREQIKNLCIRFMVKQDELSFYPIIAKIMKKAVPNLNERFTIMAEAISDIRNPLDEAPEEKSKDSDGISDLENQMNNLDNLDNNKLSDDNSDTEELKTDNKTLVKCLTIILEFLKLPDVRSIGSTLMTLKNTFVINCLESTSPLVIKLAKNVLALYCIWNKGMAKNEFLNYCLLSQDSKYGAESLGTIFDILIVHGINIYDSPPEPPASSPDKYSINDFGSDETLENTSVRQLIGLLISLLTHHEISIKIKIAEGMAKLILAGHLKSPRVLSHLILIWFNPEYENQQELRRFLGMFFNVLSVKKKGTAVMILNSFFPTLKALNYGSNSRSLVRVDQVSVAKLLISLICSDTVSECTDFDTLGSYHCRLCLMILDQLENDIFPFGVLAKSLSFISLDLLDGKFAPTLIEKMDSVLEMDIGEKALKKSLITFKDKLKELKLQYEKVKKVTRENESDDSSSESVPRKKPRAKLNKRKGKNDEKTKEANLESLQKQLSDPITISSDVEGSPKKHEIEEPLSPVILVSDSSDSEQFN